MIYLTKHCLINISVETSLLYIYIMFICVPVFPRVSRLHPTVRWTHFSNRRKSPAMIHLLDDPMVLMPVKMAREILRSVWPNGNGVNNSQLMTISTATLSRLLLFNRYTNYAERKYLLRSNRRSKPMYLLMTVWGSKDRQAIEESKLAQGTRSRKVIALLVKSTTDRQRGSTIWHEYEMDKEKSIEGESSFPAVVIWCNPSTALSVCGPLSSGCSINKLAGRHCKRNQSCIAVSRSSSARFCKCF